MRSLLRSVGLLLVLAALLVIADAAVAAYAEGEASREATEVLEAPAAVSLSGWPVGLRVLLGTVPEATVTARDVPVEGTEARLTRVRVLLTDVELRGGDGTELPPASDARFTAELDATDVASLVPLPAGFGAGLQLGDGVLRLEVAGTTIEATVTAEDGALVVRPRNGLLELAQVEVGFEHMPGAPSVDAVDITPAQATITGTLTPGR